MPIKYRLGLIESRMFVLKFSIAIVTEILCSYQPSSAPGENQADNRVR